MKISLKGKTAIVTGASSGIGKATAEYLAAEGVRLIITARRKEKLEEVAKELSSKYGVDVSSFKLDVRKYEEVTAFFRKVEQVDILINNAGLALGLDKSQDGDVDNWDAMIDTNIKGLLYMTRGALPAMIRNGNGHIVNIGSVAGRANYPSGNVYAATKHAVKALTDALRLDLSGTKIRVTEIAPGAVKTEFSEVRLKDRLKAKKVYEGYEPLHPEDIADGVIYTLTRPLHVNVSELVIYPQAQASVNLISRTTS